MSIHTVTADTFVQAFGAAAGGDVLRLEGDFGAFRPGRRTFAEPLVIDATRARITALWYAFELTGVRFVGGDWFGLRLDRSADIRIEGAAFEGPELADGYGVFLKDVQDASIEACTFAKFKAGIAFDRVYGFSILDNRFRRMRNDGITIGRSGEGEIAWCQFGETEPVSKEEHPDAIQIASKATARPTYGISIRKNRVKSLESQGICGFNHNRDYKPGEKIWQADGTYRTLTVTEKLNDGGFDDIEILDNEVCVGYPHGIMLYPARASRVLRNVVTTFPGAPNRASINVDAAVERWGNTVAAGAGKPSANDPPLRMATGPDLAPRVAELEAQVASLVSERDAATGKLAEVHAMTASGA